MDKMRYFAPASLLFLSGCAGIQFGASGDPNSMPYYVPAPALQVVTAVDCTQTATVITLPGERKSIRFRPGLGSSKLSFKISNGMLTEVNSETSGAATDAIALATALSKVVPFALRSANTACPPSIAIYAITYDSGNGVPVISSTPLFDRRPPTQRLSDATTDGIISIDNMTDGNAQ